MNDDNKNNVSTHSDKNNKHRITMEEERRGGGGLPGGIGGFSAWAFLKFLRAFQNVCTTLVSENGNVMKNRETKMPPFC